MLINLEEKRSKNNKPAQFILRYEFEKRNAHCGVTIFNIGNKPLVILTELVNDISLNDSIVAAAWSIYLNHFPRRSPNQLIFVKHQPHTLLGSPFLLVKFLWEPKSRQLSNPRLIEIDSWVWTELILFYGFHSTSVDQHTFPSATIIPFSMCDQS